MIIGYPCVNIYLRSLSQNSIRCNRTAMKKSIEKKGVNYVSTMCVKNLKDLIKILKWNVQNDIYFYRMASLLPWFNKHKIEELDDSELILELLLKAGDFIKNNNIRVGFHPAHFVKLASNTASTVKNSIKELEYYATVLDLMGLEKSDRYPINIHIGAVYDGMKPTTERMIQNYQKLSESVKERLVLENDDKSSCWGVSDLMRFNDRKDIPIVLDTLHHQFTSRGLSHQEAFNMTKETWDSNPIVHHSNSKMIYEEGNSKREHTEWIHTDTGINGNYDIMIEAGKKEQAVLRYRYYHKEEY